MESGILKLNGHSRNYPARKVMKIGINEPHTLGYTNVVLVFALLSGGLCVAILIVCIESITKKVMTPKEQKHRLFVQTQPAINRGVGHGILEE